MTLVIGIVVVFALVFGGFILSGGNLDIVLYALPYEGMMIGGGAIGAFIIANSFGTLKASVGGLAKVVKGPRWRRDDYTDLLKLMYELTRLYKADGVIALDAHVEEPQSSEIFQRYPRILADHFALDLIVDSFRMLGMQFDDRFQTEDVLNRKLKKHHHEALVPARAIQVLSDGLPAIGIVAAVLGVIKTMSSIDAAPEVLGKMIGGALVGTFLGVFAAYCFVSPIAGRLTQIIDEDAAFYEIIRDVILAMIAGHSPAVCAEIGRGNVPSKLQPPFDELEAAQRELPAA
jgi:chemotaxis protein MotA